MVQDIRTFEVAPGLGHVEGPVGYHGGCCGGANQRGHRSWVRGVAVVGDPARGPLARRGRRGRLRSALLGCLGVAWVAGGHPHGPVGVVDAVPDPSACGDLVLPLLHLGAIHDPPREGVLEGMLPLASVPRIRGDGLPRDARIARCCCADLCPTLGRVGCGIPEVPAPGRRWRGNSLPALGQRPQPAGAATMSPAASRGSVSCRASSGSA